MLVSNARTGAPPAAAAGPTEDTQKAATCKVGRYRRCRQLALNKNGATRRRCW
jgi:hypothetical protein